MKKVFLTISVIAIIAFFALSLVACNNATPQGQLQNILNDHNVETFTYEVKARNVSTDASLEGYTGTYTVKLEAKDAGTTVSGFGDADLSDVAKGILVTSVLNVGSGETATEILTGCYFNIVDGSSYMVPAASYRVQKVGGNVKFKLQARYEGKSFVYDREIDGVKDSGKLEFKATTYFDNNEFHQSLRTLTTFSDSMVFSFNMPLVSKDEAEVIVLSANVSGQQAIHNNFTANNDAYAENGIKCYKTVVSRKIDKMNITGMSHTLYYAVDDVKINGWPLKKVLVRIVEPFILDGETYEMVYDLAAHGATLE